jgi:hypothetical protein
MNTIKTLILVTLITFSTQISAFTKVPEHDLKPVSQQIENYLKNSEASIYEDIIVTIKIKLNKNNKIIVLSNDSNNYEISKFIKKRLNLKELSVDRGSNYRFFSIPIKFLSTIY